VAAAKTMPPRAKSMSAVSPAVDNLDLEATLDSNLNSDLYDKKKVVERAVPVDYTPIEATAGERVSLAKEYACWSSHYQFITSSTRKKKKKRDDPVEPKLRHWLDCMSPRARMRLLMDAGNLAVVAITGEKGLSWTSNMTLETGEEGISPKCSTPFPPLEAETVPLDDDDEHSAANGDRNGSADAAGKENSKGEGEVCSAWPQLLLVTHVKPGISHSAIAPPRQCDRLLLDTWSVRLEFCASSTVMRCFTRGLASRGVSHLQTEKDEFTFEEYSYYAEPG